MARKVAPIQLGDIDWGRPETLVRFALVSRIDVMCERVGWTRAEVAARLGITAAGLHEKLTHDGLLRSSAPEFVWQLQRFLQVADARSHQSGGELWPFYGSAMNLPSDAESVRVPASFFRPLLETGDSNNEEEVLVRAAALAGMRRQAYNLGEADRLRRELTDGPHDLVEHTLDELVTLVCLQHRHHSLAVSLAAEASDWIVPVVAKHLRESPIGWRTPQVLTRILRLHEDRIVSDRARYLVREIEAVARRAVEDNSTCPDPGRVFLEETLRRSPGVREATGDGRYVGPYQDWQWDWAPDHLFNVSFDVAAPFRQRTYAAACLARRAQTHERAAKVIAEFRKARGDDDGRFAFAADVLESTLEERSMWTTQVLHKRTTRLDAGAAMVARGPVYDCVARHFNLAADNPSQLPAQMREILGGLATTVQVAAQVLVVESILSIDATRRRTAADALIAAGAAEHASTAIAFVMGDPATPAFLRETGAVVLGYLGDPAALPTLIDLASNAHPDDVRLAATLALGEIHVDGGDAAMAESRDSALVRNTADGNVDTVRRAAVLSLATMAKSSGTEQASLALDLLGRGSSHDSATKDLATWGQHRYAADTFQRAPLAPRRHLTP